MAGTNYIWTGATNTAWDTTTNWTPNGTPGADAADTVTIDGRQTKAITTGPAGDQVLGSFVQTKAAQYDIGTASTPLAIAPAIVNLGEDVGDNSNGTPGKAYLNIGTNSAAITVKASGNGTYGLAPVQIIGTGTNTTVVVQGNANVGIGTLTPGVATTIKSLVVKDSAKVTIGSNVTIGAGGIRQEGGSIICSSNAGTLQQDAGEFILRGSATITAGTIGGTYRHQSTGTATDLDAIGSGQILIEEAATISNASVSGPSTAWDDHDGLGTYTNGVDCLNGAQTKQVDLGSSITVNKSAL